MAVQERPPPNEAPMFAESTYAREVDENSVGGTEVGLTVVATDADGDQLTYSLSGPGSAQFDVIALTGQISVSSGAILNHESDRLAAGHTDGQRSVWQLGYDERHYRCQ